MTIIRIVFLSSFFALLTPVSSSATNTNNDILQQWQTTYLNKMSPQELQFTANFLYLSYAIALVELKVRQFTTPIARLNQSIRTKIATYQTTTDDLAMLKTLIERLNYVTGARSIYIETLTVCTKYYSENMAAAISAALAGIQQDAQTKLRSWANENLNETANQLKKSSDAISTTAQHFQGISKFHKGMSEGILPVELSKEDEPNRSVIIFDTIIRNNHELLTIAENVIDILNETSDKASQIITAGAEIYKEYYTTTYNMTMLPTFDKRYATTMFGMHDVLPDEYKSLLPHPDKVFEHMLQTTKLYTQTELLQQ